MSSRWWLHTRLDVVREKEPAVSRLIITKAERSGLEGASSGCRTPFFEPARRIVKEDEEANGHLVLAKNSKVCRDSGRGAIETRTRQLTAFRTRQHSARVCLLCQRVSLHRKGRERTPGNLAHGGTLSQAHLRRDSSEPTSFPQDHSEPTKRNDKSLSDDSSFMAPVPWSTKPPNQSEPQFGSITRKSAKYSFEQSPGAAFRHQRANGVKKPNTDPRVADLAAQMELDFITKMTSTMNESGTSAKESRVLMLDLSRPAWHAKVVALIAQEDAAKSARGTPATVIATPDPDGLSRLRQMVEDTPRRGTPDAVIATPDPDDIVLSQLRRLVAKPPAHGTFDAKTPAYRTFDAKAPAYGSFDAKTPAHGTINTAASFPPNANTSAAPGNLPFDRNPVPSLQQTLALSPSLFQDGEQDKLQEPADLDHALAQTYAHQVRNALAHAELHAASLDAPVARLADNYVLYVRALQNVFVVPKGVSSAADMLAHIQRDVDVMRRRCAAIRKILPAAANVVGLGMDGVEGLKARAVGKSAVARRVRGGRSARRTMHRTDEHLHERSSRLLLARFHFTLRLNIRPDMASQMQWGTDKRQATHRRRNRIGTDSVSGHRSSSHRLDLQSPRGKRTDAKCQKPDANLWPCPLASDRQSSEATKLVSSVLMTSSFQLTQITNRAVKKRTMALSDSFISNELPPHTSILTTKSFPEASSDDQIVQVVKFIAYVSILRVFRSG
ncbi:hypothetical protein BDK51DRAFT_43952 [Blyttiomyces helicus]|uniref:Uncharacterized protein n=1 Tax=Blyttiomyces helicus TaxID=388810 RepID=A0A4P9WKB8_9FUNG|nr:hypothetical protein BDK51DRAFT_43952 [Blyttiomyces helicus]|eukprot:RKO92443.1 hypothetical protein BDK51DRAFT_43952 [Blyttiomyces helicus]